MAISKFEQKKCEKEMENFLKVHRPPPHVRHQMDIAYRLQDQSIEIFEIHPRWDNPKQQVETFVAKATYVKSHKEWRVFWFKSDIKWHRYDPNPEVKHFEDFLALVGEDELCSFWN